MGAGRETTESISHSANLGGVKVTVHCGRDKRSTHMMFPCGTKALSFRKKSSKLLGHSEELLLRERNKGGKNPLWVGEGEKSKNAAKVNK